MRLILAALATLHLAAAASAQQKVEFASADGIKLSAQVFKPAGDGPFPAVVAMHGCAGMYRDGALSSNLVEWTKTLAAAGFVTVAVDSLTPRGLKSVCTAKDGELRGPVRAQDAFGAATWLASQPYVAKNKIGLLGWSHGGGATLAAATLSTRPAVEFATAVAFYPPCKPYLDANAKPKIKLTILHGAADDWTPAAPCEAFAKANTIELVSYPGAYHNFDWPKLPITKLQGVGPAGAATIGTNEAARKASMEKTIAILKGM